MSALHDQTPNRPGAATGISPSVADTPSGTQNTVKAVNKMLEQMEGYLQEKENRQRRLEQLEERTKELKSIQETNKASTSPAPRGGTEPSAPRNAAPRHPTPPSMDEVELERLRAENASLQRRVGEVEEKNRSMDAKVTHLAKAVVKAIRERNDLEGVVEQVSKQLQQSKERLDELHAVTMQKSDLEEELRSTKLLLISRTEELKVARTESSRTANALEKHVQGEREMRRRMKHDKEVTLREITEQLSEVVQQRDSATAEAEELQYKCDRLSTELQVAVKHSKTLMERVALVEREAAGERALRQQAEQEQSPVVFDGDVPKEVSRLRRQLESQRKMVDQLEERATGFQELNDSLTARCREFEMLVGQLKRDLARSKRDQTVQALSAQSARQRLIDLRRDAIVLSSVMKTTKEDMLQAIDIAEQAELEPMLTFADQVANDLRATSSFLLELRELDVDIPTTALLEMGSVPPSRSVSPADEYTSSYQQQQHVNDMRDELVAASAKAQAASKLVSPTA